MTLSFSLSLRNALTTLAAARGIFVAPGDAGHARRARRRGLPPRLVLEGLLDERVLDDLVLDAALAELGAELASLLDGHPLEVEEDGRGHLVEARLDIADLRGLWLRVPSAFLLGGADDDAGRS